MASSPCNASYRRDCSCERPFVRGDPAQCTPPWASARPQHFSIDSSLTWIIQSPFASIPHVSALKNYAMVGFVAASIAGSIVTWKERCDPANLSPFFRFDGTAARLEREVDQLRRERDALASQVNKPRSRPTSLVSRAESR